MKAEKIHFNMPRDFGETFNVSIKFLRQNFKLYSLSILFLAGPFLLLHCFAGAYYQSVMFDKAAMVRAGRLYNMSAYGWEYFLSIFLQFVAALSLMTTSYAYMIVYSEKGPGNFTVSDVAKKLMQFSGKVIGGFFLFLFLTVIFGVAIGVVVGLAAQASIVFAILLGLAIFFGMLILAPNFFWQLSASFLVILLEDETALSGFGRTRVVMKDNYWWTWLIVICSWLMIFVIALVFSIPTALFTWLKMFHAYSEPDEYSITYMVVFVLCTFFASLIYAFLYIIFGFHYFSLAEKKDGKGLLERINEIGVRPAPESETNY